MEILYKSGIIAGLSILAGYLYHKGGTASGTKWRDAGVPTVGVIAMLVLQKTVFNGASALAYALWWGLCFGALTTYFKRKGSDAMWWNWALVGLAFGLAALPFAFLYHAWLGFILRTVLLAVGVTLWSERISVAWLEEFGRGALIILSLPLLLI